jgi:hypothetical protein
MGRAPAGRRGAAGCMPVQYTGRQTPVLPVSPVRRCSVGYHWLVAGGRPNFGQARQGAAGSMPVQYAGRQTPVSPVLTGVTGDLRPITVGFSRAWAVGRSLKTAPI